LLTALAWLYPAWMGLGNDWFGSPPLIALGSFILFAFFIGLRYEKYLARNPDFEKGALWYAINVFFLLGIIVSLRMPYCCQHDGWKMLAEPFQSLIKNMIN
jgi:hypothetical protein